MIINLSKLTSDQSRQIYLYKNNKLLELKIMISLNN